MQGVADGHKAVQGHVGQDEEGGGAQGEVEVELDHAASEGDDLLGFSRSESILGTAVMVTRISSREKLPRKKYMGVWRWVSMKIMVMMTVFPMKARR